MEIAYQTRLAAMKSFYLVTVIVIFASACVSADVETDECDTEKTEQGINVVSCNVENTSLDLIRAKMTVKSTTAAVAMLLQDYTACALWRDRCLAEHLFPATETDGQYSLMQNEADGRLPKTKGFLDLVIGGVAKVANQDKNRVTVYRRTWGWNADNKAVVFRLVGDDTHAIDTKKFVDSRTKKEGFVKVKCLRGRWVIKSDKEGRVSVLHEVVSHPGSESGFVNKYTIETIHKTFVNMKTKLAEVPYSDASALAWAKLPSIGLFDDVGLQFAECVKILKE